MNMHRFCWATVILLLGVCAGCDGAATEDQGMESEGVLIGGGPPMGDANGPSSASDQSSQGFPAPGVQTALPTVWGHTPLEDVNPAGDIVEVFITAQTKMMELREGLWVDMYTYNGMFPGPLLQATVGDRVIVHFTNDLPEPTTIHWHGLAITNAMDGTPRVQAPVEPGETFVYDFVVPDAGSFWYHPHMNTNEQLEKGLYAPFVVQEEEPPLVDNERYFMMDDILLDNEGEFLPFLEDHFEKMHGRHGNMLLTNGSADIIQGNAVQGQVERWRLVTSANARTMQLTIEGATWRIMGTDGGLIEEPYTTDVITLPVGQRYDIEVSYDEAGPAQLVSHVMALDENDNLITIPVVLATVNVAASSEPLRVVQWPAAEPMPDREIDQSVWVELNVTNDPVHGVTWMINGDAMPMEPLWVFPEGATVQM
ncbi:MAG: multicopper oxidase domain-containing protein, partial [Myxococcota bacterium]|nr:multicopper oxidase domain-containing protein [Myxococcota bacterium]